jgi:hypothetical protein
MTPVLLLILATSCLWLGSLAASTWFFVALWRIRWRPSLLLAYPLWWYSQLLITKGLSLLNGINQRSLIIATSILFAVPLVFTIILKRKNSSSEHPSLKGEDLEDAAPNSNKRAGLNNLRAALQSYWLEGIAIIYVGLVSIEAALLYAPQVWDTFNYHLPMVANWLQNGSLSPWTTGCIKQVTRTGGAEFQTLWVVGMPHVDLFVELPSMLAGVVAAVFVWEVAHRWGASKAVALAAGLSIFAVPQIFWTTLTCKDDLILTAGILCALYNAIASFSEPRRTLASFQAGVAGVSAALVCATKVPGLVFGAAFMLLFALFLLRMRMWKRFWIVTTVFVATSFPAFAIQYIHNFHQYGALFAENYVAAGVVPHRQPAHYAIGSGLVSSAYYLLKLLFFEAGRGVGPNYDRSNYGMWFSLVVLPLVALTNWRSIAARFNHKRGWSLTAVGKERLFVAAYMFLAIAAILSRRTFSTWDQRFLIWVCPLTLVLAMHAVEKYISPAFFRILCVAFTITSVRSVLATSHPAAAGISLTGAIELQPNPRYLPGYEAISGAMPGDTVLYVGGEKTAEYPCWGWKYDRTVWAADTTARVEEYLGRAPNWVVVEEAAPETLRLAALELLSALQYTRVSQDAAAQVERPLHERRTIWRRQVSLSSDGIAK